MCTFELTFLTWQINILKCIKSRENPQQRVWGHYGAIADSAFPDPVPLGTGSGNAESAITP